MARKQPAIFVCNVCGLRAPEPILCVNKGCPTELLIYGEGNKPIVLSRAN